MCSSDLCTAYMRYVGQGWEVPVAVEVRDYAQADGAHFRALFDEAYERFFGRLIDGLDVEIVSWSLRATSEVPPAQPVAWAENPAAIAAAAWRRIFDAQSGAFLDAAVVGREVMKAGDVVTGPAVITERETSTIVTASREAIMQADGCLLLRSKCAA